MLLIMRQQMVQPDAIRDKYGDKVKPIVNKENLGGSGWF